MYNRIGNIGVTHDKGSNVLKNVGLCPHLEEHSLGEIQGETRLRDPVSEVF